MELLDFLAHAKGDAWKLESGLHIIAGQIRNSKDIFVTFLQKE